jgi:hypothetical protein
LEKIPIRREIAESLRELATGEEDWSDVIVRFIDYYEEDRNSILRGENGLYQILVVNGI